MCFLEVKNLQRAWEAINEYLFLNCHKIEAMGGGNYSTEWVSYNNFVKIDRALVNPGFDFGLKLGYNYKKWSMLLNNYVDFRYLEMLKAEINARETKKAKSYNYSFHFANLHGGGKDCLVCLVFTKRIGIEHPIVNFVIRTSEVTKRLLFDFLLVERICEYVYGHNRCEIHLMAPSFYITAESFIMYNNHRNIHKMLEERGPKKLHKFQEKVLEIFDKFYNHPDPHNVMFKVNRRSMLQIQKGDDGLPLSGVKSLKAQELVLFKKTIEFPEHAISKSQRKKYMSL